MLAEAQYNYHIGSTSVYLFGIACFVHTFFVNSLIHVTIVSFQIFNTYKVGIMYCKAGQSTEEEMYNNGKLAKILEKETVY